MYEGVLFVADDEYFGSDGLGGSFSYGGLDNSAIQACREIQGSIIFGGNVSSFSDFDELEYVSDSIQFQNSGYPRREIDGRRWEVMDGMNALREVRGGIVGGPLVLGMNSLERAGGISIPSAGFLSLETVAGDLLGAATLGLSHLAVLQSIGGDFVSSAGDFGSLSSLTFIGAQLRVGGADEVDFSLPELEEIGGDLDVVQNEELLAVSVPALRRAGGHVYIYSNVSQIVPDISTFARAAFAPVEVAEEVYICANGPNDPCPNDPSCLDVHDESHCCDPGMSTTECFESLRD